MPLGFANCILNFTDGNIEYLLGKLGGIARTFRHEASMPQVAPVAYCDSGCLNFKLRHYLFFWT